MGCEIGVKVWSHNIEYLPSIKALYKAGHCDFVEIYMRLTASRQEASQWTDAQVPIRFHAPHSEGGFNPAVEEGMEEKLKALDQLEEFRRLLNPLSIIFHPGMGGSLDESIRQYELFQKAFPGIFELAYIENKPKVNHHGRDCQGADPEEIKKIIEATGFKFCLDFGHAAGAAFSVGKDWKELVSGFMDLGPSLFHLSDGNIRSAVDSHWHLGTGSYPLKEMAAYLPRGARITLETPHDRTDNLNDFIEDANYLKGLLNGY